MGSTFYDGGVFVVGVRSDKPGKVSFSSQPGNIPNIKLDRGDWTFYGLGYVGPQRMKGDLHCGMTTLSIREGESIGINLQLSSEGCSGRLARNIKIHSVQVDPCDGFYQYDYANNSFQPSVDYDPNFTCKNFPIDQSSLQASTSYYSITFLNLNNGLETEGITSSCRLYNTAADRIKLPLAIFPYKVKLYRSDETCNAGMIPHNEFNFRDGLEQGKPQEFDSFLKSIQTDKSDTRIVVPSAHTRRFKSPFMNLIPRFLCDSGMDCFNAPTAISGLPVGQPTFFHSLVPWSRPKKEQLLMKDVIAQTCSDLKHDSKFFGIKDCRIKNRFLYGTIIRNELSCRPSSIPSETYQDLYERNGKIYLLYSSWGSAFLKIFDSTGETIADYQLPDNSYSEVAASDSGDIFLSSNISGTQGFFINATGTLEQKFNDMTLIVSELEVNSDGTILYYAEDPVSNKVKSYSVRQEITLEEFNFSQTVRKIQFHKADSSLYVHVANSPNTSTFGAVHKLRLNDALSELVTMTANSISFHISNDTLYKYGQGDGPGSVITMKKNASGIWTVVNGLSGNSFLSTTADKFVAVDGSVYAIVEGSNTLVSNKFKFNGEWDNTTASGVCKDSFTINMGAMTMNFAAASEETQGTLTKNHTLFNAAISAVGIRSGTSDFNIFAFNSLNKDQTKQTWGGKLSLVQRLLGPQGVGGMLSEYASCEALRDIASISSVQKSFSVNDPYSGFRSYSIRVENRHAYIQPFTCDDNVINQTGCSNTYDLKIHVDSTGLYEKEKYKLLLSCASKKGEIEYLRYDGTEEEGQLHYWNTSVEGTARSDSYELFRKRSELKATMTYITKTSDSDIRSRSVVLEQWSDLRVSFTLDYERDNLDHRAQFYYSAGKPLEFPSLPSYTSSRNMTQYSGTASICRPVNQTMISGATTTCSMSAQSSTNSRGLPLSMATLENADIAGVPFRQLFTLSP